MLIAQLAWCAERTPFLKIVSVYATRPRGVIYNLTKGFIMNTGTVKWFNSTKGFGFIQPDNGGADAFVYISAVERSGLLSLIEGQKLTYDLEQDRKSGKMSACNLQAA